MMNWIEAALTFLKKQISLRFTMFWLLSWMVLLLFIPSGWAEFIDSRIGKWNIPYIGTAIFLIPVSFFISLMIKTLCYYLSYVPDVAIEIIKFSDVTNKIKNLTKEESQAVKYIFEKGNSDDMEDCDFKVIFRLVDKGIIYGVGADSPLSQTYYLKEEYKEAIMRLVARTK